MPIFPRFRARAEHHPWARDAPDAAVRVRWLGTAAHAIETATTTVLLDPFLSRPSLVRTATRPLEPDPTRWAHWLPRRVDALLLGHSHYDHLLDAPLIARKTGARIVGSRTTAAFARAAGVPEAQIVTVPPEGLALDVGDVHVRFVPSLHGRIVAGRVPFPGEVLTPPHLPTRVWQYRMGGAFGIHLEAAGLRLYHNGSADLIDAQLEGLDADVLLVGLAGRQGTRGYLARLAGLLAPKLIVPTHHDAFFQALERGVHLLPGIDLEGFFADARDAAPFARIVTPTYDDVLCLPPPDTNPREGVLVPRV